MTDTESAPASAADSFFGDGAIPTDGQLVSAVFTRSLWSRRRTVLWWSLGMAALTAVTIAFFPSIRSDSESFEQMLENLPEGLSTMFGVEDSAALVTPTGFLNSRLYSGIGPLLLAGFGIAMGVGVLVGDEDRGTLNLLLAQPVSRRRVVVETFAAVVAMTLAVCTVIFVVAAVFSPLVDMGLSTLNLVAANLGLALMTVVFATAAHAIGALTGNRGLTVGLSTAVAAVTFFLNGLAPLVDEIAWTQRLSPFHWLQGPDRLTDGFAPGWSLLMVAVIAVLLGVAVWGFERRDIGI